MSTILYPKRTPKTRRLMIVERVLSATTGRVSKVGNGGAYELGYMQAIDVFESILKNAAKNEGLRPGASAKKSPPTGEGTSRWGVLPQVDLILPVIVGAP